MAQQQNEYIMFIKAHAQGALSDAQLNLATSSTTLAEPPRCSLDKTGFLQIHSSVSATNHKKPLAYIYNSFFLHNLRSSIQDTDRRVKHRRSHLEEFTSLGTVLEHIRRLRCYWECEYTRDQEDDHLCAGIENTLIFKQLIVVWEHLSNYIATFQVSGDSHVLFSTTIFESTNLEFRHNHTNH